MKYAAAVALVAGHESRPDASALTAALTHIAPDWHKQAISESLPLCRGTWSLTRVSLVSTRCAMIPLRFVYRWLAARPHRQVSLPSPCTRSSSCLKPNHGRPDLWAPSSGALTSTSSARSSTASIFWPSRKKVMLSLHFLSRLPSDIKSLSPRSCHVGAGWPDAPAW